MASCCYRLIERQTNRLIYDELKKKFIVIECVTFIVMVWSHTIRSETMIDFSKGAESSKIIQNFKKGLRPYEPPPW